MSPPSPTREDAARPGDAALLRAMSATVAARGYRETSVADVLGRAGIARSTFYAHYPNKERCFEEAVDRIVDQTLAAMRASIPELGAPRELIEPPLQVLLDAVAAEPDAARVVLIETHAAGDEADARRRGARTLLARMVRRSLGGRDRHATVGSMVADAVCGGIETVVARHVRASRARELPPLAGEIASWAATHRALLSPDAPPLPDAPARPPSRRRGQAPGSLVPVGPSGRRGLPPGRKREPREVIAQTLRDRLLDATAEVAAEQGYDALKVGTIVARAETSRRSFYEHFSTIPEIFVAMLRVGAEAAAAGTLTAYAARREPATGVVAALDRLALFLAEEPAFARAGLLEGPAAGVEALATLDEALDALAGVLADAHRRLGGEHPQADLRADLSAAAVISQCAERLRTGGPETLPDAVPVLGAIALAPVLDPAGIGAAIETALEPTAR